MKRSRPNLRYISGICLEGTVKITQIIRRLG